MKRIISAAAILCLFTAGASAKKWTNNVGVGLDFQNSTFSIDSDSYSDIVQNGFGIQGSYIGVHENGFTAKFDLSMGLAFTDDVKIQDNDTNVGFYESYSLGAGYSFVNNERFLVGITGMIGLETGSYVFDETVTVGLEEHDVTTTQSDILFSAGADVFARVKVSEHFGFYANLGVRWQAAGIAIFEREDSYENGGTTYTSETDSNEMIFGKCVVEPSVGVMWVF